MKNCIKQKWLILLLLCISILETKAQINSAEYFFDTDPGIGNGIPLSMTGNMDSSSYTGNISTSGLLPGTHQLCIRSKTNDGKWSNYEIKKIKILTQGNTITQAEYFYDTDPGFGNGTQITITGNADSSDFAGNVNTVGLTVGTHQLCIRAKQIQEIGVIMRLKK